MFGLALAERMHDLRIAIPAPRDLNQDVGRVSI